MKSSILILLSVAFASPVFAAESAIVAECKDFKVEQTDLAKNGQEKLELVMGDKEVSLTPADAHAKEALGSKVQDAQLYVANSATQKDVYVEFVLSQSQIQTFTAAHGQRVNVQNCN